jgi:hypothetical protein
MIDTMTEDIVLPKLATGLFPRRPNGKKIHVSAIYRYMKHGCRGVILESVRAPGLATSRQAIARFIQALSAGGRPDGPTIRFRAVRERSYREAEQELDDLGF